MTDERSERLFRAAYWPVAAVIHWVAFRDPAKLDDNDNGVRNDVVAALRGYGAPIVERRPELTLLDKLQLQQGALVARENGQPLSPDAWATTRTQSGQLIPPRPNARFRRDDVMSIWKAPGDTEAAADAERPVDGPQMPAVQRAVLEVADRLWPDGGVPPRKKDRDDAIRKAWPGGPNKAPVSRTMQRAFKHGTKSDK